MAELLFKQVRAVIDKRTTVVCLHAAGLIMPLDEPFETLAGDFMDPPFHLHCRSLSGPWLMGMSNDIRREANAELAKRPIKQRRIGPDGEIGGSVPPPADGNGPSGYSFPGSAEKAWKPKVTPGPTVGDIIRALTGDDAAEVVKQSLKKLSPNQLTSLEDYQGSGYEDINAQLRDGDAAGAWAPEIRQLDASIAKQAPLDEPITVYRGYTRARLPDGLLDGQMVKDLAYQSTSLNRDIALDFVGDAAGRGRDPVMLELVIPKGARGINVNLAMGIDPKKMSVSDVLDDEAEFLLPRGSRIRMVGEPTPVTENGLTYWVQKAELVVD